MTRPRKGVPRLSKPGEHGGLVTLAGSAALATIVAPDRLAAAASAAAFALAFLSRGPIERAARRFRPRVWDRRVAVAYAIGLAASVAVVATTDTYAALITGLGALAIPLAGVVTVKARVHRTFAVETVALGGCGAVAGVALYAGQMPLESSLVIGTAMAAYGAATVALVRAEVRKLDAPGRVRVSWLALLWLALGAAACGATMTAFAVAFAPRGLHALVRAAFGPGSRRIGVIAVRETIELLVFIGLLSAVALGAWPPT